MALKHILMELLKIDDIFCDMNIFTTFFKCDYNVCKGACCWKKVDVNCEGGTLTKSEANELRDKKIIISKYLSKEHEIVQKRKILSKPVYISKSVYYTPLMSKNGTCAYSSTDCILRQAHKDGNISFPIPLNCALYPIIDYSYKQNRYLLMSHSWDTECEAAYKLGAEMKIPVFEFCKDSIIRLHGISFYEKLETFYNIKNNI